MNKKFLITGGAVALLVCVAVSSFFLISHNNRIEPIVFPEELSIHHSLPETIENQIPQEKIEEIFGKELNIYKIISPQMTEKTNHLLKIFEMENYSITEYTYSTDYDTAEKRLTMYPDGSYSFNYKRDLRESVNFTLEELIPIAENDLTELGLMPDNFYQGGQSGYRLSDGETEPIVLSFGPSFYREIDGYTVYGSSFIRTEYDNQGLLEIFARYSDYTFDRTVTALDFEEAYSLIRSEYAQNSFEDLTIGEIDKIILDDVRLVYYDTGDISDPGTHILPCYVFEGMAYSGEETTEFQSWVMAIPRSMTTE